MANGWAIGIKTGKQRTKITTITIEFKYPYKILIFLYKLQVINTD